MTRNPVPSFGQRRRSASRAVTLLLGLAAVALADAAQPDASPAVDTAASPTPAAGAAGAQEAPEPRRRDRERRGTERAPTANTVDTEPAPEPAAATAVTAAEEVTAEAASEPEADEIVCRNMKVLGTNMRRRVCATAEQWAESRRASTDAAQEGMRQMRDRTTVVVSQPENPLGLGN